MSEVLLVRWRLETVDNRLKKELQFVLFQLDSLILLLVQVEHKLAHFHKESDLGLQLIKLGEH